VTVTLILKDDGGVLNGGVDASAPQTFQIKINPINDAPSFTIPASKAINEDAGAQEEVGFVSSFSAGPADEAVQSLAWTVSSTNPGLFTDVPVLVGTTLKYKTAPNANGSSVVTVRLKDNGGIDGSGVDETVKTWTLTVNPVNDAPSFTKGSDLAVKNYQAIQTIANWIKSKTAGGGADEAAQTFTFQVSSDLPSIFASQPSIDASGALTFAPSVNQYGIANVTVTIQDNGGIANGGANTSVAQTFKIEVQDTVMDEMGNSYPFKKLGTQTWMLQNMRNGAGVVPCDGKSGCSQTQLIGSNFSFASAFKLPATCNTTACSNLISNPIQGVCPVGWHIPAQTEWYTLMSFAGAGPDDPVAQSNLMATWSYEACSRSSSTATPVCKYSPGLDAFGFALPANRQNGGGGPGGAASWATFSMVWLPEEDPTYATSASALYNLSQDYTSKAVGSGVRCIKN
jgi:uncharacterized protein (TIGR02145 family)